MNAYELAVYRSVFESKSRKAKISEKKILIWKWREKRQQKVLLLVDDASITLA